ncbi:MAG: Asp-tRNA(Asn)/Glu-tRNA(Gln) amidotransferase subunit GatB [Gemmatimonadaceae bacterium]
MSAATRAPDEALGTRYEMVVGLEVHVQLRTRTKAFCSCSASYGAPPNANTCPVCLALPGTLPVLNHQAVLLAVRAARSLGCTVHPISVFARKNYFYPDLPKGYQISQYDQPLATGGCIAIGERADKTPISVRITRVHMEEDAGKSIHDRYRGMTAIDLNRAGVPLIEVVSEPDMRSAVEAGAYLRVLRQLLEYADVSDVSMEEGSLRVDANISIRERGETRLGTKTEVKNMNSFSGVERALEAEFRRQSALLERGQPVVQQTLLWDAARGDVRPSRAKEGSHDYRYFPEPDLPPLVLTAEWIAHQEKSLPELPAGKRQRFASTYQLSAYDIELLTASPRLADYFESVASAHGDAKAAANWVMGEVLKEVNSLGIGIREFRIRPQDLARLLDLVRDDLVSHSAAKRIFAIMSRTGDRPEQVAEREGLLQVGDRDQLSRWVDEVLAENPTEAARFRAGETKLLGVLVGLVMKRSRGSADPRRVNQLLSERSGA